MLCEVLDVEALIQTDITSDVDPRILRLIELASEEINGAIGRPMEAETGLVLTVSAGITRSTILLPRWPLAAVTEVDEDGTVLVDGTDYLADLTAGLLVRQSSGVPIFWNWPLEVLSVTVTTVTPGDVRALCARLVANAFEAGLAIANRPTQLAGLRQLTIGRWSATADTGAAGPGIFLDASAQKVVDRWKDRRAD